jgi:hypothetical protein
VNVHNDPFIFFKRAKIKYYYATQYHSAKITFYLPGNKKYEKKRGKQQKINGILYI